MPRAMGVYAEGHAEEQVLTVLTDNAKHNQHGHVDEHGAIWHHHAELCPVGAIALLFFTHFHVLHHPPPDFAPDFMWKDCGEYGYREWYHHFIFYAGTPSKEMSYNSRFSPRLLTE